MQAIISRRGRVGKTPVVVLAVVAGLTLGAAGGYSINNLLRPSSITPGAAQNQTNSSSTYLPVSATRHAASEHEGAEAVDGVSR